ncbi:MAG: prolipoprotein diacylglyceryl transferase [Clostridiales bacterium]|nr:prolipoprotein diacylglyceryl transferase [Clostridiales bacterium]
MNFEFLSDYTSVKFTGLDKIFDVAATAFSFRNPFTDTIVNVRWYGIIIALGFTLAALFGGRMAYKWKMDLNKMVDVLIYGTFGGIIGARLFYVAFKWDYYAEHLSEIFQIWNGGLAIYGGIIGGLIAAYITCRAEKLNFRNLLDLAGMSLLIGQGIGRWGNFTNQEAFGTNTDLPWGMTSNKVTSYIVRHLDEFEANGFTMDPSLPVHPTFLYESLWCLIGFVLLYIICRKYRKFSGQIILCYGIWYGIGRTIFEGLRTDSLYISGTSIRVSQLISAVMVVVFSALLIYLLAKYKKNPQPIEGVDFFPEPEVKTDKKADAKNAAGNDVVETVIFEEKSGESSGDADEPQAEQEEKADE